MSLKDEIVLELAKDIKENAFKLVPKKTRKLADSIKYKKIGNGIAKVYSTAGYASAVHNGRRSFVQTPNTFINPPKGSRNLKGMTPQQYKPIAALKFKWGGKTIFRKQSTLKATKPNPFLTDAAEKTMKTPNILKPLIDKYAYQEIIKNFATKKFIFKIKL